MKVSFAKASTQAKRIMQGLQGRGNVVESVRTVASYEAALTKAAQWLKENDFRSVRLVTTDWHMARASTEFSETLPPEIRVVEDAVSSHPNLATLFLEYNKLLAAAISQGLPS